MPPPDPPHPAVTDAQAGVEATATVEGGDARRAIALTVGVAATVAFVVLRLVVALGDHAPLAVDVWWGELMAATQTPVGLAIAWFPAIVGGVIGAPIAVAVIALILLLARRGWDAANLGIAFVLVVAIGSSMAAIIARARPEDSLAESVATSFPSGHTAVATTVCVTLGLLLRRWYVWAAGVAWIALMAWSRTYLQAHWLSDVVAGLLEGVAVACLVWCAVEAVRDRRAARAEPGARPAPLPHPE